MIFFILTILFQVNFNSAYLSISKPDSLIEYGSDYEIILTLSFDSTSTDKMDKQIPVSDQIEAKLTGSSFRIISNKSAFQKLGQNKKLIWSWTINAQEIGQQFLHIEVLSTVLYNKNKQKRVFSNYKADLQYQVNTSDVINKYLSEYGLLLGICTLILISIFLMFQFKKNNNRLKKQIK